MDYEKKLARVMERIGAERYNYDWSRREDWVKFVLQGRLYRFDRSVDKARERGFQLNYGADEFAQIVLALEDLARMAEQGLYEIQTWLSGMKFLPPPVVLPTCIRALGFEEMPAGMEEVKTRFRTLAMTTHLDQGGAEETFVSLQEAALQAVDLLSGGSGEECRSIAFLESRTAELQKRLEEAPDQYQQSVEGQQDRQLLSELSQTLDHLLQERGAIHAFLRSVRERDLEAWLIMDMYYISKSSPSMQAVAMRMGWQAESTPRNKIKKYFDQTEQTE